MSPVVRSRLTRDGRVALLAGAALLVVGWLSANNLLYGIAAPVWAALLAAWPLGRWNLRGLEVRRALPPELVAGREAPGRLLIRNPRRWRSARDLTLREQDLDAGGACGRVPPGRIGEIPVRWRFGARGRATLSGVTLSSTFPFGWTEHALSLPLPAEVLVWPRPLPVGADQAHGRPVAGDEDPAAGLGAGDFVGLRAYRPGDSPRSVHWLRSARLGTLVVVERSGETEVAVEIVVPPGAGPAWEREVSRAAGEIQRALQLGRRVGLRLPPTAQGPEKVVPPSSGGPWRRTLMDLLALLPGGAR